MHFDSIISPKRAKYILDNTLLGGDFKYSFNQGFNPNQTIHQDGVTKAEFEELQYFMANYPHNTCMNSILCDISLGIYKVLNKIHSLLNVKVRINESSLVDHRFHFKIGEVIEEIPNQFEKHRDSRGYRIKFDENELPVSSLILPLYCF